ncbi:MAG: hypothetical protein AAFY56_10600 [Pseudomonadota bacterium]
MQIGDTQFLEIGQARPQPLEIACEPIDIANGTELPVIQEPGRVGFSLRIECAQIVGASRPGPGRSLHDLLEVPEKIVAIAIECVQHLENAREFDLQSIVKDALFAFRQHSIERR